MDLISLPWLVTRAAAVTAYVLLFLMITMGEMMASGELYNFIMPPRAWTLHKYLGISFVFALLAHITSLFFDKFVSFGAGDVLVPFYTSYRPFPVALGVVGFYLVVIIMMSSLIARFQQDFWWRKLHFLTYPLFALGLFHGILSGTDSGNLLMVVLYSLTGIIFIFLLFRRFRLALSRR